ncbi:hypothetical protein GWI33_015933 [Rhynchophorus ferrugineus]|uniref:Uncharacterized protein n=1 Tax=Rhynchophorus ferrugineus TaxID=354439 RepID=A0A834HZT4_RHYFE|nr:hypothetical protein GWI33_015933 [Rhynchophorus ferrugineus]
MNFMNTELMDSFLSAFCGAIAVTYGELYDIYLMPLDKMGGFGDIIEFSMITYFFIFSGIFCLVFFIKALMDSHNPLIPAYVTADIFTILSYIFTLYAFGQVTLNRCNVRYHGGFYQVHGGLICSGLLLTSSL